MKLIHTGDLHIGKIVNGFSMLEEQHHVLLQILDLAKAEKADAIVLAGDIYDRAVPRAEAVQLFDFFLGKCSELGISVIGISGNHDSPERIAFAKISLAKDGIYLEGKMSEEPAKVTFSDAWGTVTFHLLPYAGGAELFSVYGSGKENGEPEKRNGSLSEAVKAAVSRMNLKKGERHVLVTHHFVGSGGIEPETCDSEQHIMVGGTDLVDASLFDAFDYTALGHLHGAQKIGEGSVYYSGSPVKYSFSEVNQKKSVWVTELREKGTVIVNRHFLKPVHDMRVIKGPLAELLSPAVYELFDREDYICARLTDEGELYQPADTLRSIYPNLMQLILEKNLSEEETECFSGRKKEQKTPEELFFDFYLEVTGKEPDEERKKAAKEAFDSARREEP